MFISEINRAILVAILLLLDLMSGKLSSLCHFTFSNSFLITTLVLDPNAIFRHSKLLQTQLELKLNMAKSRYDRVTFCKFLVKLARFSSFICLKTSVYFCLSLQVTP